MTHENAHDSAQTQASGRIPAKTKVFYDQRHIGYLGKDD